jgi:hypothetical protein
MIREVPEDFAVELKRLKVLVVSAITKAVPNMLDFDQLQACLYEPDALIEPALVSIVRGAVTRNARSVEIDLV